MCLGECLPRTRQRDFADLPDPRFGLGDGGPGLRDGRALVGIVQHDQHGAALDLLALHDGNAHDAVRIYGTHRHALRRHHATAGDDRLDDVATRHDGRCDGRTEQRVAKHITGDRDDNRRHRDTQHPRPRNAANRSGRDREPRGIGNGGRSREDHYRGAAQTPS